MQPALNEDIRLDDGSNTLFSSIKIINMDENGNTSAASIPLALDFAVKSGSVKKGDVLACAGFGAGLSWGAAIFRWEGELLQ